MDVRPEVRNSAVRTLFAVVAGQGGRMSSATWEECLWQMLFPLLRSVHHLAATSSKEEVSRCTSTCLPAHFCLFCIYHASILTEMQNIMHSARH